MSEQKQPEAEAEAEEAPSYNPRNAETTQPEGHGAPTTHRAYDEDPLDPEGEGSDE